MCQSLTATIAIRYKLKVSSTDSSAKPVTNNDPIRKILVALRTGVLSGIVSFLVGSLSQAQTPQSVTLAWDPSPDPTVVGYLVYYGNSSGNYTQSFDVGNATTATVSNLTAGQYFFVVTSYNSAGVESAPSTVVTFPGTKDFLGTGQADLVWEDTTTGQRLIWIMQNGLPAYSINLPTVPAEWHIAGIGDFLGNGQADLVWEDTITGQRLIWIMQNGVLASAINLPTVSTEWQIVGAGDFLGNGQADLVWEDTITGQRVIWIMQNGVLASTINLPTVSTEWHIAGVGDFLGTGQAGLVWEDIATGQRVIWIMQSGALASTINLPTVPTEWHIVDH